MQCAVIKGYELTVGGNFDCTKGTWRNFLYTGMRNEMTNFLYRHNKETPVNDVIRETYKAEVDITFLFTDFEEDMKDII